MQHLKVVFFFFFTLSDWFILDFCLIQTILANEKYKEELRRPRFIQYALPVSQVMLNKCESIKSTIRTEIGGNFPLLPTVLEAPIPDFSYQQWKENAFYIYYALVENNNVHIFIGLLAFLLWPYKVWNMFTKSSLWRIGILEKHWVMCKKEKQV